MQFEAYRVRAAPSSNEAWVPLDYWGGNSTEASLIMGMILGICSNLPESIGAVELMQLLPEQVDKDIGSNFINSLLDTADQVLAKYGRSQDGVSGIRP
jgi:hypothetical protein